MKNTPGCAMDIRLESEDRIRCYDSRIEVRLEHIIFRGEGVV